MGKRKSKLKPWFKTLLFIFALVILGTFLALKFTGNNESKSNNNKSKDKPAVKETKKVYKLSMIMAGDALLHGYLNTDAKQSDGTYNYMKMFRYVKDYVKDYDLRYWNQETIFGGTKYSDGSKRPYSGYPRFNTPSAFGDNMIDDMGFNIVTTANNHAMDQYESGLLNSVEYWKTKDILWNGTADSEETRNNFIIKEKNNITYGILSYTDHTNGLPVPKGKSYLVNVWDEEQAKKDIETLRPQVDVLMVAMHWGIEYTHKPVQKQRDQAKFLADQGVDIIIGCHPHVIEPIEKIVNEETGKETIVFYSLGNFISNQTDENTRVGLFGTLDITKTVEKGKSTITIDNIGGELHYTYRDLPSHRNYVVIPFSNPDIAKYLKNYKTAYEKYKNIVTGGNEEFKIVPLSE
ncbi:MAG: CapA family protein [Bacilli bacterium]|nr:CapA family protein [Bacilli bacterium]